MRWQLQNQSSTFILENNSLLPGNSVLSGQPERFSFLGQANLNWLCRVPELSGRFGSFSWSKNDSNYLDGNLNVFKAGKNRDFQLVQKSIMGEYKISTNSIDWGISWSLKREPLVENKIVPHTDTSSVQIHGWTTQTGSYGVSRFGSSKQKDICDNVAVQGG